MVAVACIMSVYLLVSEVAMASCTVACTMSVSLLVSEVAMAAEFMCRNLLHASYLHSLD